MGTGALEDNKQMVYTLEVEDLNSLSSDVQLMSIYATLELAQEAGDSYAANRVSTLKLEQLFEPWTDDGGVWVKTVGFRKIYIYQMPVLDFNPYIDQ